MAARDLAPGWDIFAPGELDARLAVERENERREVAFWLEQRARELQAATTRESLCASLLLELAQGIRKGAHDETP